MLMLTALLLLAGILTVLFLPLRIQTDVHHGERRLMRISVTLAGVTRVWRLESRKGGKGREVILGGGLLNRSPHVIQTSPKQNEWLKRSLRELRHNKPVRRFLRRHVHTQQLDIQLLLHTSTAAGTALATGMLRFLFSWLTAETLQRSRIRILPDFLRERSTLQARCIFSLRLGTILISAALLLLTRLTQGMKREAQAIWNTPSEP